MSNFKEVYFAFVLLPFKSCPLDLSMASLKTSALINLGRMKFVTQNWTHSTNDSLKWKRGLKNWDRIYITVNVEMWSSWDARDSHQTQNSKVTFLRNAFQGRFMMIIYILEQVCAFLISWDSFQKGQKRSLKQKRMNYGIDPSPRELTLTKLSLVRATMCNSVAQKETNPQKWNCNLDHLKPYHFSFEQSRTKKWLPETS